MKTNLPFPGPIGLFITCTLLLLSVLTASAQIKYVTPTGNGTQDGDSWTNAYPASQLQAVLSQSPASTTVLVGAGLYKPTATTDRTQSFSIASGVQVYGGYTAGTDVRTTNPSSTTLSGDIDNNSTLDDGNSYHVVQFKNASAQTRLDGITLTGGYANNLDGNRSGGGIVNDGSGTGNQSNPTLNQCTFIQNFAYDGGAMYNNGREGGVSSPILTDCRFIQNSSGVYSFANDGGTTSPILTNCSFSQNRGAFRTYVDDGGTSNPILTNCSFTQNTFYALRTESASDADETTNLSVSRPRITNCSFIGNTEGTAVDNNSQNGLLEPVFTNCRFIRNEGSRGGAVENDANTQANLQLTMVNCIFIGNQADLGGAIFNDLFGRTSDGRSALNRSTLINCSFYQNTSTENQGNVIYNEGGIDTDGGGTSTIRSIHSLINCILWDNGGASAFFNAVEEGVNLSLTVAHSLIETGTTGFTDGGDNRVGQDPKFTDAANDDLSLTACSPAINAGTNSATALNGVTTDLAGNSRFFNDGPIDLGAYEFQGSPLAALLLTSNVSTQPVFQNTPGVALSITGCTTGTLNWTGTNGTTGTGTTISVPTSATGTLVYSATCTAGSCTSSPGSATITVAPPLITGSFDGFVYGADCATFRGWAWDRNKPNTAVSVDILDGPNVIASLSADVFRQDLQTAGKGNGRHAFFFSIPDNLKDGLPHNLSARVSGSSFILKDSPKALICQGTGSPANKAPVPPSPTVLIAPLVAQVGVPFSGTLVAFTDPEAQPLTYQLTGLPDGLSISMTSRVISGTPTQAGTFVLTYSASDGVLTNSVSFPLTVNPASTTTVTGSFEGYLDKLDCGGIRGWVWDRNKPNTPLTVEFYLEGSGTVLGSALANIYRQDLKDAGKGNGAHAYNFSPPGSVTNGTLIRARVLGSTYDLKGSPRAYQCAPARLSAETASQLAVTVLGNPVSDQVVVEIRGAEGQPLRLQLTDASGRLIGQRHVPEAGLVERHQFDVSQQAPGLLFLRVTNSTQSAFLKLIRP
ncbi:putative Ig domain-containing protein [Larkinella sp. GY13]|uniref:putative Ig domain-containing protein n=1 Tax=Larkinella sp. GY13 TaxID=3453720 RepID=UPI003EEB4895